MARGFKPVAGSRAFWPKKRARRIYPGLRGRISHKDVAPVVFAGYKAGMTRVVLNDTRKGSPTQGRELTRAVTVLECPALFVCGIKLYKKTHSGLKDAGAAWSERLHDYLHRKTHLPSKREKSRLEGLEKAVAEGRAADVRLLVHTKPRESGTGKRRPELFEIELGGKDAIEKWGYAKEMLGKEIKAEDVFRAGDWVDISAITKGKGYQGPVKRFGVKIRTRKDSGKRRHIGNIGSTGVGRVLPGKIAMPGQLGFQRRTEYNKRILRIGTVSDRAQINPSGGWLNYGLIKSGFIILDGSVAGPKKRLVMMRRGVRAPENRREQIEIRDIVLDSQQGV